MKVWKCLNLWQQLIYFPYVMRGTLYKKWYIIQTVKNKLFNWNKKHYYPKTDICSYLWSTVLQYKVKIHASFLLLAAQFFRMIVCVLTSWESAPHFLKYLTIFSFLCKTLHILVLHEGKYIVRQIISFSNKTILTFSGKLTFTLTNWMSLCLPFHMLSYLKGEFTRKCKFSHHFLFRMTLFLLLNISRVCPYSASQW